MGDLSPFENEAEYLKSYKDIVSDVFDVENTLDEDEDALKGASFLGFKANYERIQSLAKKKIPEEILLMHIMCNQAARARSEITNGEKWENLPEIAEFYENQTLNRYGSKSTTKKKAVEMPQSSESDASTSPPPRIKTGKKRRSQLDLDDLDMDSDMEQKLRPKKTPKKTVNMHDFLKKLKLEKLKDLATVAEMTLKERWDGEEPARSHEQIMAYEVYEYPDTPETKSSMEEALFQSLLKLGRKAQKEGKDNLVYASTGTVKPKASSSSIRANASVTSSDSLPRGGFSSMIDSMKNGSSGNFSGMFADNREEGQIFWEDVLEDMYLKKVMERGDNFDEDWRKLKMTCGGLYHSMFNKTHPKDPIQGKRVYLEEHRGNMEKIAQRFVKKFKNIIDEIKAEEAE